MTGSTVIVTGSYPIQITGGRTLAPGEIAEIPLDNPHELGLMSSGLITEISRPPLAPARKKSKEDN